MSLITDENERIEGQGGDREAAISQVPAPCDCSIALTEGELTDLQGIESWLSATDDVCPPDPLGRGVRMRWLKTLASILDQSNAQAQPPKVG